MTELGINPKDIVGAEKLPLDLIPAAAESAEAHVMGLGARKYGAWNWRKNKVKASIYVAAARRHLMQWFSGENIDPESGVSHLGHVRACMGILLDAEATGNLVDDRTKTPNLKLGVLPKRETNPSASWGDKVQKMQDELLRPVRQCDKCGSQITGTICECETRAMLEHGLARSIEQNIAAIASRQSGDSYYTWGGARYKISADRVYQWNSLAGEWQLSTMLPKHLREDGTEVSAAAIIFSEAAQ